MNNFDRWFNRQREQFNIEVSDIGQQFAVLEIAKNKSLTHLSKSLIVDSIEYCYIFEEEDK